MCSDCAVGSQNADRSNRIRK